MAEHIETPLGPLCGATHTGGQSLNADEALDVAHLGVNGLARACGCTPCRQTFWSAWHARRALRRSKPVAAATRKAA